MGYCRNDSPSVLWRASVTISRRFVALIAASGLGLAGAVALPTSALAADVFVTTTADNGPGSLRAALENSLAGDTIRFDSFFNVEQVIELESELIIDHTITIIGPGSDLLSLVRDDASAFNQFEVQAEGGVTDLDVTVSGMTIDGSVDGTPHAGQGSGFQSLDATVNNLLFQDVVIRNQIATHGAAINVENAEESIFFANCHLFNNIADSSGGAARFTSLDADVSFNGGSISSNQARAGNGGGLEFVGPGALTMYGTAVTSNTAVDLGGGLYLQGPTDITLENTFFQDNGAWSGGGVYVNIYNGDFDITTNTFDDNFASGSDGGALNVQTLDPAQTLTVTSSLFSDNRAASDGVEAGAAIATGSIDGEVTIDSSTFSQNNFAEPGRGLSLAVMGAVNGELSIVNSTIDESSPPMISRSTSAACPVWASSRSRTRPSPDRARCGLPRTTRMRPSRSATPSSTARWMSRPPRWRPRTTCSPNRSAPHSWTTARAASASRTSDS